MEWGRIAWVRLDVVAVGVLLAPDRDTDPVLQRLAPEPPLLAGTA